MRKRERPMSRRSLQSVVTSGNRPNEDSQANVLLRGNRCALPSGEKRFHAGLS